MTLTSVDLKLNHISGLWSLSNVVTAQKLISRQYLKAEICMNAFLCLSLSVAYSTRRCAVKIVSPAIPGWSLLPELTSCVFGCVRPPGLRVNGQSREGLILNLSLFFSSTSQFWWRFCVLCSVYIHYSLHLSTHCIHYWFSWLFLFYLKLTIHLMCLKCIHVQFAFLSLILGQFMTNWGTCPESEPATSGSQSKNDTPLTQNHMSTCWCRWRQSQEITRWHFYRLNNY